VSTLAAQTGPPRSIRKAASAARVPIWPTAAPLVRNSPRGWTPRSLTTIRLSGRRAVGVEPRRTRLLPEHQGDAEATARTRWRVPSCRAPSSRLRLRLCSLSACLPTMPPRALARPTRTSGSGRVFGAHPRGEFRTSGAAVGQIGTQAASAAFPCRTRRTCLSSEGGHRRLCAVTSKSRRLCAATSRHRRLCSATSGS